MARGLHVVAGSAKGIPLVAPDDARPTTGRVREALFSALGDLTGTSVLDLFAGSGALGIEALSRGAASAVLVDRDRASITAIERNLAATRLDESGRAVRAPVTSFVAGRLPREAPFDLVLMDPPYDLGDDELLGALEALAGPGWLADDARVVVERASRGPLAVLPPPWRAGWERKYGDTLVIVLDRLA